MKKLILALLVVALAIPAMAADISLTDNGDGTGNIVLTVTGAEVVRGLAIVVDAGVDVTAVAGTDAIFNVFMDAAFTAEDAVAGSYAVGDGTPIADPDAAGELALAAGVTRISLCMGVLDEGGFQGGAVAGTYNIGTITTGEATVTISADTLRGGIVGDAIVAGTIAGGLITDVPATCVSESAPFFTLWQSVGSPACWCYAQQCKGDVNGAKQGNAITGYSWVSTADLTVFLAAYNVKEAPKGLGIATVVNGICADFTHSKQGNAITGYAHVSTGDLTVLLSSYNVKEPPKGLGIGDCAGSDYNFFITP